MIDFLAWLGFVEDKHITAAIGGLFGFTGVVFTGLAAICAWLGKQYLMRRERRRDIRNALRAEVESQWRMLYISPLSDEVLPEIARRLKAKGGKNYSPYFSSYLNSDIYAEIKSEIAILGDEEIPHIVRFYHHMSVMDGFVATLQEEKFASFDAERKLQMIGHLFEMVDFAVHLAERALLALEGSLKTPRSRTIDYIRRTELAQTSRFAQR